MSIPEEGYAVRIRRDVPYGPHGARNLLDLYVPHDAPGPRPGIVFIHGGGWRGGSKEGLDWYAVEAARRGYSAASINYRFWPDACAPAAYDDAQRAVRWTRAHADDFGLDAARLGAIGDSAGGHLASLLGLTDTRDDSDADLAGHSSRVACVVDIYGPVDFLAMMESASAEIVQGFMGTGASGAEESYREMSPVTYVSEGAPPFLVVHGTEDVGESVGQVPISISRDFAERLEATGADATFLAIEGAGHGFFGGPGNDASRRAWAAAVPFFERCLGGPRSDRLG